MGVWSTPRPQIAADQGRYLTGLLRRLGYRASLHLLAPDTRFFDYANDSRNGAQVISGGWNADYSSLPRSSARWAAGSSCRAAP